MAQVHAHRLTKYVHIQNKLGPDQTTKRAICKACESKEQIFEQGKNEGIELRCPYWREFWVDEDQEVITYEDPDKNMA
ncbi:22591_t:CDS:2, partial [Gigaspora rosea]